MCSVLSCILLKALSIRRRGPHQQCAPARQATSTACYMASTPHCMLHGPAGGSFWQKFHVCLPFNRHNTGSLKARMTLIEKESILQHKDIRWRKGRHPWRRAGAGLSGAAAAAFPQCVKGGHWATFAPPLSPVDLPNQSDQHWGPYLTCEPIWLPTRITWPGGLAPGTTNSRMRTKTPSAVGPGSSAQPVGSGTDAPSMGWRGGRAPPLGSEGTCRPSDQRLMRTGPTALACPSTSCLGALFGGLTVTIK